jgi:hypothetical protein
VGVLAGVTKIRGKLGKKEWKKIITKCGAGCGGAGGDSSVDAADATRS